MPLMPAPDCELCETDGGEILFRHPDFRIVRVTGIEGETYRGFCRVIWQRHVKEMSELNYGERSRFMDAVFRLETALRQALQPDKINLASLGNMTPHLHWHVIPRFHDDATFPKPIWAAVDASTIPPPGSPFSPPPSGAMDGKKAVFNVDWAAVVRQAFGP